MNFNIIAHITVKFLKNINPHSRLLFAANLFWISLLGAIISTVFIANSWFERTLMLISWFAITITCVDIVASSDIRDEQEEEKLT